MQNSKIISLLKTLTPGELKSFDDFVHSPFFNKSQYLSILFDSIKKFYPEFKSESLSKEKIINKLYPGKKYNDERMRNLSSDLLNLGKEFLAQTSYQSDPFFSKKFLIDGLEERKLDGLYDKFSKSAGKFLEEDYKIDENYFLYKIYLELSKTTHFFNRNNHEQYFSSYYNLSEELVVFLLVRILAASSEIKISKDMINRNLDNNLANWIIDNTDFEKLINYLKENKHKYSGVLEMYLKRYKAFLDIGEDKYYYEFRDLFYRIINLFNRKEKYNLYSDLSSICASKIRSGKEFYRKEYLKVTRKRFDENVYSYSEKDFMDVNLFRNAAYSCVFLGETNYLEAVKEKFIIKLDPKYRKNMLYYSNALIQFAKCSFEKSLYFLSRVTYETFLFKIDIKNFTIMCYYELNLLEEAFPLIDTYKHFLSKSKSVSSQVKKFNYDFIRILELLIRIKLKMIKPDKFNLKKEINNCTEVANKPWLMLKIEELKN